MYDIKEYIKVSSLDEALDILDKRKEARLICGGTDVLIKVREGKLSDLVLVDISDITDLHRIEKKEDGSITIGPAATFTEISENPLIKAYLPMLAEAVSLVGGPQIRNMGTIGGNVCNGATSADSATTLLVYNARLEIRSAQSSRQVALKDFYAGPSKVKLEEGEILAAIHIDEKDYAGGAGAYVKTSTRKAMDIATIGTAAYLKLDGDHVLEARVAYGVAAPTPIRCPKAEKWAQGQTYDEAFLSEMAERCQAETSPRDSWRASKNYRLQIIREQCKNALAASYERAGE